MGCAFVNCKSEQKSITKKIRIVLRYGFLILLKSFINERALQVSLEQPEERNLLRVQGSNSRKPNDELQEAHLASFRERAELE
jgi:hypothetical protein